VEEALKALAHAQQHIPKLEQETAELRQRIDALGDPAATAALVKQLLEEERKTIAPTAVVVDESTVAGAVEAALKRQEAEREAAANERAIEEALSKRYGDKAKETLTAAATELGLNMEEMRALVRTKPGLARKALGLDAASAATSPPFLSSVNVNSLQPATPSAPKPVMYGATSADIKASWEYAGQIARKNLGIT
jgi:hypothetical protein